MAANLKLGTSFFCPAGLLLLSFWIVAQEEKTETRTNESPSKVVQQTDGPVVDKTAVAENDNASTTETKKEEEQAGPNPRFGETERQKEARAAVEAERKARGTSVKSLSTKLAEHALNPKRTLDLTFDDLVFDMEKKDRFKRTMLSSDINKLHGKQVKLSGYIRPSARQNGITKFVFVRDNMECCFGPGAALFDCVLVKLAKGVDTEFTVRPITVEGQFYMKEFTGPNGRVWAVYRMKDGRVK